MAENKKKIWVWSEGNPEFVASKEYIESGEKYKDIGDFSQFKSIIFGYLLLSRLCIEHVQTRSIIIIHL